MQNDPVVGKASELLRLGLMPSLDDIKAGKVHIDAPSLEISQELTRYQDPLSVDISTASTLQKVAA